MSTSIRSRDLARSVGQLLIIGFDGTEMSPGLASLLTRVQPAGVILFARNITGGEQTYKLLKDCQACVSTPLFTCVDMEGGRVDRFRNVIGSTPSAADVFATGNRKLFRKHGKVIGESCRALGFNTDFAPVVDLAFEASKTVMSSRAVSADPKQAVIYAREFLAGLRSANVIGSAKHFPGLGEANLDTHHELPSVNKSWKKLWAEDLYPYRTMRRELPMILIGHANYPAVTHDQSPASLSKKVDHRRSAQENRLSRTGRLRRSGNGRSSESRAHRAGGRRTHPRRRRPLPDLPYRGIRHPFLRSTDQGSRARTASLPDE